MVARKYANVGNQRVNETIGTGWFDKGPFIMREVTFATSKLNNTYDGPNPMMHHEDSAKAAMKCAHG